MVINSFAATARLCDTFVFMEVCGEKNEKWLLCRGRIRAWNGEKKTNWNILEIVRERCVCVSVPTWLSSVFTVRIQRSVSALGAFIFIYYQIMICRVGRLAYISSHYNFFFFFQFNSIFPGVNVRPSVHAVWIGGVRLYDVRTESRTQFVWNILSFFCETTHEEIVLIKWMSRSQTPFRRKRGRARDRIELNLMLVKMWSHGIWWIIHRMKGEHWKRRIHNAKCAFKRRIVHSAMNVANRHAVCLHQLNSRLGDAANAPCLSLSGDQSTLNWRYRVLRVLLAFSLLLVLAPKRSSAPSSHSIAPRLFETAN